MSSGSNNQEVNTPFRDIRRASSGQLAKRAWWIIALNFLIPGSAQVLAGNRRIGRIGILFTLAFWGFLVLVVLLSLISKLALFTILLNPFIAIPIGILFICYAALIAYLSFDSLRLMKLSIVESRGKPVMIVLLLVTAITASFVTGTIGSTALTATNLINGMFVNSGSLEQHKGRYNILLIGGDSGSNRFGLRPDSISVLSISAETGNAVNIGLPRNLTRIQFTPGSPIKKVYPYGYNHDCGGPCLLNAIYKSTMDNYKHLYPDAKKRGSTAGMEATKSAVQWVTGLKIDAYVMINMKSFVGLIDAIGGIEVNVKKPLPIGGQIDCVDADNEHGSICPDAMGWIEKGKQHMDGRTALWYARSRHNTNDYDRMRRQREVENIVLKKIDLPTLLFRFGAIAGAGAKLVTTDIPAGDVPKLMDLAFKAKSKGLKSLQLSYPVIQADNPDFWLMRHLIAEKLRKYN
ncbi:MAG: LytR family transcriptional regulator [Micrococcales bacterium]|nr:LytR family transcriptional regulator [Micrococcales bacterium]